MRTLPVFVGAAQIADIFLPEKCQPRAIGLLQPESACLRKANKAGEVDL
jgi:hypothetical protein